MQIDKTITLASFLVENELSLILNYHPRNWVDDIPLWCAELAPQYSEYYCLYKGMKVESPLVGTPQDAIDLLIDSIRGKRIHIYSDSLSLGNGGLVKYIDVPDKLVYPREDYV